ncbi:glucoamylase family protein [Fulvivirga sp. M361]|uniref:glucoamylase family protein n=1 Tax=Fulvivirga sp. M361 TaxID=2594266 RepID=UPI002102E0F1|nr:glucoamylase family protein [Fulvivirga sp. M361]
MNFLITTVYFSEMVRILVVVFALFHLACSDDESPEVSVQIEIEQVLVGSIPLSASNENTLIPVDRTINVKFTQQIDTNTVASAVTLLQGEKEIDLTFTFSSDKRSVAIDHDVLDFLTSYRLIISDQLMGENSEKFAAKTFEFMTANGEIKVERILLNGESFNTSLIAQNIPTMASFQIDFSEELDLSTDFSEVITLKRPTFSEVLDFDLLENRRSLIVSTGSEMDYLTKYKFDISSTLTNARDYSFSGFSFDFYTQLDSTFKFPEVTDEELLTLVQQQTFKYFWDFAHPNSGLIRERNTSGNLVTIGGSGFGVMAVLVGIERGFITREQGIDRLETIVNFLSSANRFHGAWPHWMDGVTGETIPFSNNDDGADLVETAFMVQGLLTVRQYLDKTNVREVNIITAINRLWEEVEWDWFTQGGQELLYWHWSPNAGWQKNLPIRGWNESLIVYVLAAASPTHAVSAEVYHNGWARSGGMANGGTFYTTDLPLGPDLGGPLFFSHYSFLGLDPRKLKDQYADYWQQNVNHTLINRAYVVDNPLNYVGYSSSCWGLTASDNHLGYSAHAPDNDLGVITPTAALSAMPYTPEESMTALKHFYYLLGDRLWGEYGFYDAFNLTENWTASSYLAIDQGPIILMIENHRTALLWDLFMSNEEITAGLEKLKFEIF